MPAKKILRALITEISFSDPNEVSLLHVLQLIHSLKSIEWIVSSKGGAQQDLLVGGMQRLAEALAKKVEGAIHYKAPVRSIDEDKNGVVISADGITVNAKQAIVAIPPILAGRIHYTPTLPALKNQLMDRSPAGQGIRCYALYPEPFWRADGYTGTYANMDERVPQLCIDVTPPVENRAF